MGKGNRNRIAKEQEKAQKQKELEKKQRRQRRIKIATAVLVPCFAVVLIGAIVLGSLSAAGNSCAALYRSPPTAMKSTTP